MSEGCGTCKELIKTEWDKEELSTQLKRISEASGSPLKPDEIDERLDICNLCPFRNGHGCTKKENVVIVQWMMARQPCPEDLWPELEPLTDDERRGVAVDDHGNIYKNNKLFQRNPCGDCIHRRKARVRFSDPPFIQPYCKLINSAVTWQECCDCEVRETDRHVAHPGE